MARAPCLACCGVYVDEFTKLYYIRFKEQLHDKVQIMHCAIAALAKALRTSRTGISASGLDDAEFNIPIGDDKKSAYDVKSMIAKRCDIAAPERVQLYRALENDDVDIDNDENLKYVVMKHMDEVY